MNWAPALAPRTFVVVVVGWTAVPFQLVSVQNPDSEARRGARSAPKRRTGTSARPLETMRGTLKPRRRRLQGRRLRCVGLCKAHKEDLPRGLEELPRLFRSSAEALRAPWSHAYWEALGSHAPGRAASSGKSLREAWTGEGGRVPLTTHLRLLI